MGTFYPGEGGEIVGGYVGGGTYLGFMMWPGFAGGNAPLVPPSGFDWEPPVNVFRDGAGFVTDFNADDWKVSASVDIYVSESGNDTTGNGSQALPYRGIRKALQVAAAGADVGYNIFVSAGEYTQGNGFLGQACDRNINLIATGGRVLATNKFAVTSWTLDGAGTYRATRNGVTDVRDYLYPVTWPNGDQTPQILTKVADVATCQATPSSWYTDLTTVWVHLQDGRSPDAGAGQVNKCGIILGSNAFLMQHNRSWFMQGFDIEGGGTTCIGARAATTVPITQLVLDDCRAWLQKGVTDRCVRLDGVQTAILNNVRVFHNEGDGMGYSRRDASSPSCKAMEIDCHSYSSGYAATTNNAQNGSTNHAQGRTIRVNSVYRDTYGPVVADINDVQSWCLGVDAQDCLLSTSDSQDSCFQQTSATGSGPKMWLDSCIFGGAHYDLYADTGCQILYRNMTPSTTGGSGTISTY